MAKACTAVKMLASKARVARIMGYFLYLGSFFIIVGRYYTIWVHITRSSHYNRDQIPSQSLSGYLTLEHVADLLNGDLHGITISCPAFIPCLSRMIKHCVKIVTLDIQPATDTDHFQILRFIRCNGYVCRRASNISRSLLRQENGENTLFFFPMNKVTDNLSRINELIIFFVQLVTNI